MKTAHDVVSVTSITDFDYPSLQYTREVHWEVLAAVFALGRDVRTPLVFCLTIHAVTDITLAEEPKQNTGEIG